uniref:Direct IAP-binding protein with low pI n=1 Tax=Amphilophus citrinellus TaxID=61819 RepID=A0A3Q0RHH6_AMPCI
MQAVRQCTVCASRATGALVWNQTDMSVLRLNKSSLRRGANSNLCCLLKLAPSRKPGNQKLGEPTKPSHMSIASLSVAHGLCAAPFTQQVENLSHDSLIRRAATVVTDSSCTFLSQTTLAYVDALTEYSKAVHSRIAFQRRYLASLGKLTQAEEDSFQQAINSWRAEVSFERLVECKRYESAWINAVSLCKMAAEAACASGAQQASNSLRTNIQVAQSQVEDALKLSAEADKKLAETKVEEIQRMAEYTSFLEDSEEREVHEAYLRED